MNHINHSSDIFSRRWRRKRGTYRVNSRKICGNLHDLRAFLLQKPLLPIAFLLQSYCYFYCSETCKVLNMNKINGAWGRGVEKSERAESESAVIPMTNKKQNEKDKPAFLPILAC